MELNGQKFFEFKKKSALAVCVAAGFFCVIISATVSAQERPGADKDKRYEVIDKDEGARRLNSFRDQRLEGDYCFRFELEHLPWREKRVRYHGTMWGTWNDLGPISRVIIPAVVDEETGSVQVPSVDLIIQNGPAPLAWLRDAEGNFEELNGEALFDPLIPGITYSAFDLQMPFIYWDEFEYEGPARVQSRVAQRFLMQPPIGSVAASRGISSVRVGLDDAYDALLRVEVLSDEQKELSRFTVESFKKVQGQYIVKKVTLKDYETKDRTRFHVKAASVGMLLTKDMFNPFDSVEPKQILENMFEVL